MITQIDMETGEILERSGLRTAVPSRAGSVTILPEPYAATALQEIRPLPIRGTRMPPDLALLDIAEVLARFS